MNNTSRGFFVHHPVGRAKKAEPTKTSQKAEPGELRGLHVTWRAGRFKLIREVRSDLTVRFLITLEDTQTVLRFLYAEDASRVFEQLIRSNVVAVDIPRTSRRYRHDAA